MELFLKDSWKNARSLFAETMAELRNDSVYKCEMIGLMEVSDGMDTSLEKETREEVSVILKRIAESYVFPEEDRKLFLHSMEEELSQEVEALVDAIKSQL